MGLTLCHSDLPCLKEHQVSNYVLRFSDVFPEAETSVFGVVLYHGFDLPPRLSFFEASLGSVRRRLPEQELMTDLGLNL